MDPLSHSILSDGLEIIVMGLGLIVLWVLWERWWD